MTIYKVKDERFMFKDMDTKAVVSTDAAGLSAYKERKTKSRNDRDRINTLEQKVAQMDQKIDLILQLLQKESK